MVKQKLSVKIKKTGEGLEYCQVVTGHGLVLKKIPSNPVFEVIIKNVSLTEINYLDGQLVGGYREFKKQGEKKRREVFPLKEEEEKIAELAKQLSREIERLYGCESTDCEPKKNH